VSVVLAARDAEGTIGEAVRSVLGQTLAELELVVVDDGSVDGTGEALARVEDPRLRLVRNEAPLGLAGALNVGLDAARGAYVARLDADDRWARPQGHVPERQEKERHRGQHITHRNGNFR